MSYIYDIVLNFQDNYYNFFEWSRDDKLKNVIKIPLYKVSDKDIIYFKNNKIRVDDSFINRIIKDNKNYKKIICLVSNGKIAIGLLFNSEGFLLKRSSLLFEEEEEACEVAKHLSLTQVNYKENIKIEYQNKLRIEKEKKDKLIEYIKNNNSLDTLKYLYYEYYEKEANNLDIIKNSLLRELSKEWGTKQNNLYNLINILSNVK